MDYVGRLHLYPQRRWYATADVVGDRHAPTTLRTALGNTTDNEDHRGVVLLSHPRGQRRRGGAWSDPAPPSMPPPVG
jgi:hypothetical protein